MRSFSRNILVVFFFLLLCANLAQAQGRRKRIVEEPSPLSWDLGAAFGSYDNLSYSEIDLGLSYRFHKPWNWRNVLWDRIASSPVSAAGVDTSIRFEVRDTGAGSDFGYLFFIGPGVRISSNQYTGAFAEGGGLFKLGGLVLGAGLKVINYNSPGKDPTTGLTLANQDTVIFIILAGGGYL